MNFPNSMVLLHGTAGASLAAQVAGILEHDVARSFVEHFPDGEINVRLDEPVRGRDVFVIQPTSPPVTDNLFELLAFCDACRRSAARSITAVIPYFGYARSDKRHGRREPIMASLIAELLQTVGIQHVLTVDLHAPQIEGFFRIPVDNLTAVPVMATALRPYLPNGVVVVAPDEGRVKMGAEFARWLNTRVVVLHKHRASGTSANVVRVVGDVQGQACLIVDDIISTGGTIAEAVKALLRAGAKPHIHVAATHGILTNGARDRLSHPAISRIFITDSVPRGHASWPELKVISLAPLLAAAVRRLHANESMAELYARPIGTSAGVFVPEILTTTKGDDAA
jgi:ribose-phosphate pyrophosphokinase